MESHVERGATAHADGLAGYRGLPDAGIKYRPEVIGNPKRASKRFPKVHRVASLLKRIILGTLQGRISCGWLPWLLAEFEFQFNRRRSEKRPLLFARTIEFRAAGERKDTALLHRERHNVPPNGANLKLVVMLLRVSVRPSTPRRERV